MVMVVVSPYQILWSYPTRTPGASTCVAQTIYHKWETTHFLARGIPTRARHVLYNYRNQYQLWRQCSICQHV